MTIRTFIQSNFQRHFLSVAALRAILRCEVRSDLNHLFISIFSFIIGETNQLIPTHIGNRFRKTMIFNHSFDVQIFKDNDIVGIYKKSRNFMSKVRTSVFNSVVNFCNYLSFFMAFFTSFCLFAQTSLSRCQNLFISFEKSRILNFNAIAQCAKGRDSDIATNTFICRFRNILCGFNGKTSKPFAATITRNGQSFNFSDYVSVKFDFNFSGFGKLKSVVSQRESALSKSKGIISLFILKSRKASLAFLRFYTPKETLKRFIGTLQNVLANLTVNIFVFWIRFLNFFELVSLVVIVKRNSIEFVGVMPFSQSRIVEKSTQIERIFKFGCLSLTRKNAKAKSFLYSRFIHLLKLIPLVESVGSFRRCKRLFDLFPLYTKTKTKYTMERRLSTTNFKANWKWSCG